MFCEFCNRECFSKDKIFLFPEVCYDCGAKAMLDKEKLIQEIKDLKWQVANWERKEIERDSCCRKNEKKVAELEGAIREVELEVPPAVTIDEFFPGNYKWVRPELPDNWTWQNVTEPIFEAKTLAGQWYGIAIFYIFHRHLFSNIDIYQE